MEMHCQEKKEAATREGASLCLSQEPFRHSNFNWVSFSTEMERGRERMTHKRGISGKRWNSFFYKKVSYKPKQLRRTSNIPRGMDREREREREREKERGPSHRCGERRDGKTITAPSRASDAAARAAVTIKQYQDDDGDGGGEQRHVCLCRRLRLLLRLRLGRRDSKEDKANAWEKGGKTERGAKTVRSQIR